MLTLLAQINDLTGQLYYLKRQLFGKKSEKLMYCFRRKWTNHLAL